MQPLNINNIGPSVSDLLCANVCQTCGDVGYKELLLCCSKCQISMEHRYCLRKLPDADDYMCALCVSTSTEQTSHKRPFQHVTRSRSCRRRKRRQLLQYQNKGKINRTFPVIMNAETQKHKSPQLQTSGSEPFAKDVLSQPYQDDSNCHPSIGQPAAFGQDLKMRPVTISSLVEAEGEVRTPSTIPSLQTSGPHSEVQTQCISPLQTSAPKPLVKNVPPKTYVEKNNRCPQRTQDMKTRLWKSSSSIAVTEAEVKASNPFAKDVPSEASLGKNSRCPHEADPPVASVQDMKTELVKSSSFIAEVKVQGSESLVKDVLPETSLGKNSMCPRKTEPPAAGVQDTKMGLEKSSSFVAETEPKVQASKPPVKDVLPESHLGKTSRCLRNADPAAECVQDIAETVAKVQVSKPIVKDVPPESNLGKNSRCSRKADPAAECVQEIKTGLVKSSSSIAEVKAEMQVSKLLVKDVLPEAYPDKNNSCPHNPYPPAAHVQDKKTGLVKSSSIAETGVAVQAPKPLVKDVLPETFLGKNSRFPLKAEPHTAHVQDVKTGLVKSSYSIAETEATVQAPTVPPSTQTSNALMVNVVIPEANLNESKTDSRCFDVNGNDVGELKNIRRLVHPDLGKSDGVEGQVPQTDPVPYAQPLIDPVWRGCFELSRERLGSIVAHLSNKACLKVVEAAKSLPIVLCINMMSRLEVWPKSFTERAPTDENIALYFFAGSQSSSKGYDQLVSHIVNRDLALKVYLDNVELLMFTSNQLPLKFRRFCGRYYLWGVFRGRQNLSVDTQVGSTGCPVSLSALGINRSDSPESMRMSPLSPLNRSGSCPSDSSCSPLAQTTNRQGAWGNKTTK